MVNPNTKGFDHFTDEAFYYGWCENCGLGVALTDKEEIRNEILEKYHRFKKENACEPHYANCRIVQRDSGQVKDVRIMLSPDTGMADDGIFFYCPHIGKPYWAVRSRQGKFHPYGMFRFCLADRQRKDGTAGI